MTIEFCLYIVLANGYGDLVITISVSLLCLSIFRLQIAIDIEHNTLSWYVGAIVVYIALHWERRNILKIYVIGSQTGGTDEH